MTGCGGRRSNRFEPLLRTALLVAVVALLRALDGSRAFDAFGGGHTVDLPLVSTNDRLRPLIVGAMTSASFQAS